MAASDPCHWGPVVVCRQGGSISDDLVTGLARVALKPLVGFFTEGITCRVDRYMRGCPCPEARAHIHHGQWWQDGSPSLLPCLHPSHLSPTNVAVVHPDAMPVVFAVALHRVVGEVTFCYLKIWVDNHL